ncbi:hypothetical protein LC608_30920 [Nostoc sp. XA010]|uniref:hypothetical protein n=1 Tax=Nostoc sp. XA010 TaxID=2780407 RepID=UPI001E4542BB|nr:hypothetical protein [Nostoc sp. XA010]MCC5661292.1 hypothetical protein [Nostoc sp. XA010]
MCQEVALQQEWVLLPQNFASVYHVGGVLTTLLRPAGGLRPSFASLKTQKFRSPLRGVCTLLAQGVGCGV